MRFSPSRSRVQAEIAARRMRDQEDYIKSPPINTLNTDMYFCHYNNGVYMGGFKNYKRHGKGIVLHDDGSFAITQYSHNNLIGQTIIFRNDSFTSFIFKNNSQCQIVYKRYKYILKLPFDLKIGQAHGKGILIDYQKDHIYELIFNKGKLVNKTLYLDKNTRNQIFRDNKLAKIIGQTHENALHLHLDLHQKIKIKQRQDINMYRIGFYNSSNTALHGLACKLQIQNLSGPGYKPLIIRIIQRGYYKNNLLFSFGQITLSNKNKYIGQFQQGKYHGKGIYTCPSQMKWTYGYYQSGKLTKILHEPGVKSSRKQYKQCLLKIHQRHAERYINDYIQLPQNQYIEIQLKNSLQKQFQIPEDLQKKQRQERQRLQKIQKLYQQGHPGYLNDRQLQYSQSQYSPSNKSSRIKSSKYHPSSSTKFIQTPINKLQQNFNQQYQNKYRSRQRNSDLIKIVPVQITQQQDQQPQYQYKRYKEKQPQNQIYNYKKSPRTQRFNKYVQDSQYIPRQRSYQKRNNNLYRQYQDYLYGYPQGYSYRFPKQKSRQRLYQKQYSPSPQKLYKQYASTPLKYQQDQDLPKDKKNKQEYIMPKTPKSKTTYRNFIKNNHQIWS